MDANTSCLPSADQAGATALRWMIGNASWEAAASPTIEAAPAASAARTMEIATARMTRVWHSFLPECVSARCNSGSSTEVRTLPPMAEPRPAALPPAERTVGQLVAESIQFYGGHFWACLVLGVPAAVIAVVFTQVSHRTALILAPTLSAALISATFVYGSVVVLEASPPPRRRLVAAWLMGWLVFVPVPFLVIAFILPGLLWLAALGLVVPVLVTENVSLRAALPRAWQLARADFVHALGSMFTLAVVVLLSQSVLVFVLRGFGNAAGSVALFLASVVLSPLLFVGAALLYVDQAARIQVD